MKRRHALLLLATTAAQGFPAHAQPAAPPEVSAELPAARLQGHGRLTFFGVLVYDIRLWVNDLVTARTIAERPFALELEYALELHGHQIAENSLEEMRRIGPIAAADAERWLQSMEKLFPDVAKGDRLTGIHRPEQATRFFHNGRVRGEVRDAKFARAFFAIWLHEKTSEPKLRLALLGLPS